MDLAVTRGPRNWLTTQVDGRPFYGAASKYTSDRWYQEKRESYLGLLQALHDAAIHPSDKNSMAFALWQTRCELFGSKDVAMYAQAMVDTNDGPGEQRDEAFKNLIQAMKADFGPDR